MLIYPIILLFTFIAHFQVTKTLGKQKGVVMQSLAGGISITLDVAEVRMQDLAVAQGGTQCLWWYGDTQKSCLWGNPVAAYQLLLCLLQI